MHLPSLGNLCSGKFSFLPLPQGSVEKIREWSCWAGCWPLPKVYPLLSPMTTPCHFFLSGPRASYEWKTQGVGHRVLGKVTLPGEVPVGHRLGSDLWHHCSCALPWLSPGKSSPRILRSGSRGVLSQYPLPAVWGLGFPMSACQGNGDRTMVN